MAYDVEIRTLERRHTAVVRFSAAPQEMAQHMGAAFGEIGSYLGPLGAMGPETRVFARYLDMSGQVFDVEAGFTVPSPVEGSGRVQPGELPACEAAMTLHVGPYDALGAAYDAVQAWMAANQRLPGGAPWEEYLSDPQTAPPAEWKTEVYWPLVPRQHG